MGGIATEPGTGTAPAGADATGRRLDEIERALPEAARAVAIYRAILPLLDGADLRPSPVVLDAGAARARLESGVPLLCGAAPAFDIPAARDLMVRLARRLEELAVANAAPIRRALEDSLFDPASLLSRLLPGADASADPRALRLGLDSLLLSTIARDALKPALRCWRGQLAPHFADGPRWDRGSCWACGTPAAFGELRGNGLSRHLRCGACGAGWPYPRIRCAWCGNRDHATLGIVYADPGPDKARAECCDACRGYIKTIVTFEPTPTRMIALEDLATVALDGIAQRRGYARP